MDKQKARRLGQHWLFDKPTLHKIVQAGEVGSSDTVLEVGPGLGTLTELLLTKAKRVIAVEKDRNLVAQLAKSGFATPKLEIIEGDILEFDLKRLPPNYKVVANIPYYLTSNLLRYVLENLNPPVLMALLVQKEVAERIVAKPGQMSLLAFSVQYYARPKLIDVVSKELFQPPPKVDSAILQIKLRPQPYFAGDPRKLFRLVKAGFSSKRKQLKNSLAAGLGLKPTECSQILENLRIDPKLRAEDLHFTQWQKIYHKFTNL